MQLCGRSLKWRNPSLELIGNNSIIDYHYRLKADLKNEKVDLCTQNGL
jgi:hypothetical protein